jgi:hypothetical protein
MRVVVMVFKGHFVDVFVAMAVIAVDVLMNDVFVLVAGVRVFVQLVAMGVRVVVGCVVCMFCRHVLPAFA